MERSLEEVLRNAEKEVKQGKIELAQSLDQLSNKVNLILSSDHSVNELYPLWREIQILREANKLASAVGLALSYLRDDSNTKGILEFVTENESIMEMVEYTVKNMTLMKKG